jgi:hypothetical protein
MVWQRFVQFVAQIPPDAEPVSDRAHEETFRTHTFEKHHELQFEEDDWINGWSASQGVGILHQRVDEGEIKHTVEIAIEVIRRNYVLEGYRVRLCTAARFHT